MSPYNFPLESVRRAGTLGIKPDWSSPFFKRDPLNPTGHWPPEVRSVIDRYPHIRAALIEVLTAEREQEKCK